MQLPITDHDDPRLLPFRHLKGNDSPSRHGLFVVEGEKLVERLLASDIEFVSLLVCSRLAERYESRMPTGAAMLVASDAMLSEIVGFDFHRGVLACGRRPASCCPGFEHHNPVEALALLAKGNVLVACPLIHDPENLGLIIRTAAGLGADGLLVSNSGADVFARRCLRVSMGAAFSMPIVQLADTNTALRSLQSEHGFQLIATTLADHAQSLDSFQPASRFALLMGSEPDGLSADVVAMADVCVSIPMQRGIDSHNVAVATGILLQNLISRRVGD